MSRPVESVDARAAKLRAKLRKQLAMRQYLVLDVNWELVPLCVQLITDVDAPGHPLLCL